MSRRRRIAVDGTPITGRAKGAGRVVKNLLTALPKVDPENTYVALVTEEGARILQDGLHDIELAAVPAMSGLRWETVGMGKAGRKQGADLMFTVREAVGFGGPPTVMHLFEPPAYRLHPRGTEGARALKPVAKDWFLHANLRASIKRASAVTAGSEDTAAWLRRKYGIEPRVIPGGIEAAFFAHIETDARGTGDVPRYFLHPASGDPRENTELVLQAFARASLSNIVLRTFGTPEWLQATIRSRASALGLSDLVITEGWVSDERLRALYAGALALLHPSRYEGFGGYPALEAMALGIPVVALAAPGTREALAGAALLVEQENPELLAHALTELADSPTLRTSLVLAGRERVRGLTWEAAAKAFVTVFHDVLA
ncbi:MAG: glycosyltransferase [Actinomycetota bacterium]